MEGGGERKRKAGPIALDWEKLLPSSPEDEPPPQVVVEGVGREPESGMEGGEEGSSDDDYVRKISDKDLHEKIDRQKRMLGSDEVSFRLPDGGGKLMARLKRLEAEQERRKLPKEDDKCKKVIPVVDESACNADDSSAHGAPPSKPDSRSAFALRFCSKLDNKGATKPFSEELSTLNHSNHKTVRGNGPRPWRIPNLGSSSREDPFKPPNHLAVISDKPPQPNNAQSRSPRSTPLLNHCDSRSSVSGCFATEGNASLSRSTLSSRRNRKTVVLVDEELEVDLKCQADQVGRSTKEERIYYPSGDDPEAIEICYSDMECLAPNTYLSSTIMNFYIRYLQKPTSPNSRKSHDYHFFNTYFYNKLQWDSSSKIDKETFKKFRRWWKGVNIFEKAYIFLPIHEK